MLCDIMRCMQPAFNIVGFASGVYYCSSCTCVKDGAFSSDRTEDFIGGFSARTMLHVRWVYSPANDCNRNQHIANSGAATLAVHRRPRRFTGICCDETPQGSTNQDAARDSPQMGSGFVFLGNRLGHYIGSRVCCCGHYGACRIHILISCI